MESSRSGLVAKSRGSRAVERYPARDEQELIEEVLDPGMSLSSEDVRRAAFHAARRVCCERPELAEKFAAVLRVPAASLLCSSERRPTSQVGLLETL